MANDGIVKLHHEYMQHVGGDTTAAAMLVLADRLGQVAPAAQPSPQNLSVKQAAKELGISSAKVYQLCESGQLRHRKIGRAIRIQHDDLQAFMDTCPVEAATTAFPLLRG